ncbi:DUF6233 domain-containing protein [Streptomyces sp. 8N616]|uniref:DUF6233 domain-containing protein n=1 Tax=Streptomyces sp. 8N616 TaxID=3457414 RepID=UPI003FD230EB
MAEEAALPGRGPGGVPAVQITTAEALELLADPDVLSCDICRPQRALRPGAP